MDFLAIALVLGVLLIIVTSVDRRSAGVFRSTAGGLESDIARLELRIAELTGEQGQLQDRVTKLQAKLGGGNGGGGGGGLSATVAPPKAAGKGQSLTAYLLQNKIVTQEQLNKVEAYRKGSGSDLSIEELLVMFDYASREAIARAKQVCG